MSKKLIIVESPTKARTIRKFLSKDYEVESCMGHLRDLPESAKDIPVKYKKYKWSSLGVNVDDEFQPIYCTPDSKLKVLKQLKSKAKTSKEIILATDEDREGESISWHLKELLKTSNKKVSFKRMVFHEITKEAILKSLKNFRTINQHLVDAQEARRVLDRLVGYSISPVLWKKVARGLSAGRVQSVAVRLLSERELKRMDFQKAQYWSVEASLSKGRDLFKAQLVSYKNQEIAGSADFDRDTGKLAKTKKLLLNEVKSQKMINYIKNCDLEVSDIKTQSISKSPQAPFTTSTLQQEANRKLLLSAKETMSLAQQLYEKGFITYMRTDAVFLSKEAIQASRKSIQKHFGKEYVSKEVRSYQNKSKGAQEAHEAIRPSGSSFAHPVDTGLSGNLLKLYQTIWQRTLASQASECKQKRVSAKIKAGKDALLSASGTTVLFDGFYKIYGQQKESVKNFLPSLKVKDSLKCKKIESIEHETKPPARYTEASLVQMLEKEGIGRPSTYAPIIATIQKRGYAFKDKNMLIPTMTGIIVTEFLKKCFPNYVNTQFTSDMEQVLDEIALGSKEHTKYLKEIYYGKNGLYNQVESQNKKKNTKDTKSIEFKDMKGFTFFAGPYGAYFSITNKEKEVASASLPPNTYPADLQTKDLHMLIESKNKQNNQLGTDPKTGHPIYVLVGRFGPYVQRGNIKDHKKEEIKRVAIPKGLDEQDVDLQTALTLLELPKVIGTHPETGKEIKKGLGRFGPYVVHDGDFRSVRVLDDFFNLTLEQSVQIINQPKPIRGGKKVLKELGVHPETKKNVQVLDGKYGPYVQHHSQRVSIPSGQTLSTMTLKQALDLLNVSNKGQKKKASKKTSKVGARKIKTKKIV